MLDIFGDRGVLKDVIREGVGELVTSDVLVLGIFCVWDFCFREVGDVDGLGLSGS